MTDATQDDAQHHLVCVHPFHGYEKGQIVKDPAEVEKLKADRDHHFVKIAAPPAAAPAPTPLPTVSLVAK